MSSKLGVQNIAHTNGTNAMTIASDGATAFANAPTGIITSRTTVATTSGTEVDFTSIPSTVKRITVIFRGLSTNGGNNLLVQIGTSGGLATSSYISTSSWGASGISNTTGYVIYGVANALVLSGTMQIYHMGSNVWVSSHSAKYNAFNGVMGGGDVALSGTLDRLRITPDGSNTFDAGSVNIMYES